MAVIILTQVAVSYLLLLITKIETRLFSQNRLKVVAGVCDLTSTV